MLPHARNRYRQVDNLTAVTGRSPAELIVLVYDRIADKLRQAETALAQRQLDTFRQSLNEAIDLITQGLLAALDFERGGDVALNLGRLYDYAVRSLLRASLWNDVQPVREVAALMRDLRESWAGIAAPQAAAPSLAA